MYRPNLTCLWDIKKIQILSVYRKESFRECNDSGFFLPGGGGTPYGKATHERGTFFRLKVYERVGISQVEVYKRVGKRSFRNLIGPWTE